MTTTTKQTRTTRTTSEIGCASVMVARSALHAMGWNTARPEVDSGADVWAETPDGEIKRIQVRTIIVRDTEKRRGEYVIPARKSNGEPFQPDEVDYLIGVLGSRAWLVPCTGKSEYWSGAYGDTSRWTEITPNYAKELAEKEAQL